jgi:hypothetical protein
MAYKQLAGQVCVLGRVLLVELVLDFRDDGHGAPLRGAGGLHQVVHDVVPEVQHPLGPRARQPVELLHEQCV